MGWTLETNVNDGYPHNTNTRYGNPGLVAPYPDGMWTIQPGVNDGYPHSTNTRYGNPGLVAPYPDGMWMIQPGVNDGYPQNTNTRYGNPGLVAPYPDGMWMIQSGVNDGYPFKQINNTVPLGACCMCEGLYDITFPVSVLHIGRYACYGTGLSTVRIAPACSYYSTSFPADCLVYHYTEDSNLVDKNGRYLMSRDKKLLKVKEVTNG